MEDVWLGSRGFMGKRLPLRLPIPRTSHQRHHHLVLSRGSSTLRIWIGCRQRQARQRRCRQRRWPDRRRLPRGRRSRRASCLFVSLVFWVQSGSTGCLCDFTVVADILSSHLEDFQQYTQGTICQVESWSTTIHVSTSPCIIHRTRGRVGSHVKVYCHRILPRDVTVSDPFAVGLPFLVSRHSFSPLTQYRVSLDDNSHSRPGNNL